MTWKHCMYCLKACDIADNVVAVRCHQEEPCVQSDTAKHIEDKTHNQSADSARNETHGRLIEEERNEYQNLNNPNENTIVNDQSQQDRASGLDGNSHDKEENKRYERKINSSLITADIFFKYLVNEIKIKLSDREVKAITQAVEHLVFSLLSKLGEHEPSLKSSELVHTGSCYDGTKILQSDEFDFLAVIDCLSLNNVTAEVSTNSCAAGGYAHASCEEVSPDWSRVIEQDGDHCVIASLKSKSLRTVFRECFHLVLFNEIDKAFSVETPTGVLILEGFSVPLNGPQCNVKVLWTPNNSSNSLPIDIDISPAIKCELKTAMTVSDVINDEVFKVMSQEQYLYLIPRPKMTCCKCFKMVFPHSDRRLVTELSESHRDVLLVLKYISHEVLKFNFRLKTFFNSFTMKNALLYHSFKCKEAQCQGQTVSECLMTTLEYMMRKLDSQSPEMTCVFTVSRNLWKNAEQSEIVSAHVILRNVTRTLKEITSRNDTDYDLHELKCELSHACSNAIALNAVSKCARGND